MNQSAVDQVREARQRQEACRRSGWRTGLTQVFRHWVIANTEPASRRPLAGLDPVLGRCWTSPRRSGSASAGTTRFAANAPGRFSPPRRA